MPEGADSNTSVTQKPLILPTLGTTEAVRLDSSPAVHGDKTVISKRSTGVPVVIPEPMRPPDLGRTLVGERLGHFELEEFVGGGGMGAVFRARDTMLGRTVAVKVVSRENTEDEMLRRFRNEAQSAARLDHPNIARVYYVGEDRGWNYIVFEFIEGVNVRDLVAHKGPLPMAEAISYTWQVAEALEHAAERDVVHRDIKPSNILVMPDGRAKLVDMGLARLHQVDAPSQDLTATGVTLGTFDYISPEQARDPRSADIRSDLYSLGCTLFFMLTGMPPFPEGTVLQKLLSHSSDPPPDPREYRADLDDELCGIALRLMAKLPQQRFQSATEFIDRLSVLSDRLGLPHERRGSIVTVMPPRTGMSRVAFHLPWLVPLFLLFGAVFGAEWWIADDAIVRQELGRPESTGKSAGNTPAFVAATPAGRGTASNVGETRTGNRDSSERNNLQEATSPATTNPATTNPATTNPATTIPATTIPATTNPATTNPATTKPATTDPATAKPDASNPDATDPEATDSARTDPDATHVDTHTTDTASPGAADPSPSPGRSSKTGPTEGHSKSVGPPFAGKADTLSSPAAETSRGAAGDSAGDGDSTRDRVAAATGNSSEETARGTAGRDEVDRGKGEEPATKDKVSSNIAPGDADVNPSPGESNAGAARPNNTPARIDVVPSRPIRNLIVSPDESPSDDPSLCSSLEAAIQRAAATPEVDTIELRFPYRIERPLTFAAREDNSELTVKAAAGYMPLVHFRPSPGDMLADRSMLRIVGGKVNFVGVHFRVDMTQLLGDEWSLFHLRQIKAVTFRDCTFTVVNDVGVQVAMFYVEGPPRSRMLADGMPTSTVRPQRPTIEMTNCIARGQANLVRSIEGLPFRLHWSQGFLATSAPVVYVRGLRETGGAEVIDVVLRRITATLQNQLCLVDIENNATLVPKMTVDCNECVFDIQDDDIPLTEHRGVDNLEVLMRNLYTQTGHRNRYSPAFEILWRVRTREAQERDLMWGADGEWYKEQLSEKFTPWRDPMRIQNKPVHFYLPSDYSLVAEEASMAGFDEAQLPGIPAPPADRQAAKGDDAELE